VGNASGEEKPRKRKFPADVASVLSRTRLVINRGADDGIRLNQRFLVYELTDQSIYDPTSKEFLGYLENPKGTGVVIHTQERIATIESDKLDEVLGIRSRVPFAQLKEGDKVRPI
jgi:hypothetical protein